VQNTHIKNTKSYINIMGSTAKRIAAVKTLG